VARVGVIAVYQHSEEGSAHGRCPRCRMSSGMMDVGLQRESVADVAVNRGCLDDMVVPL
jgi:hypothetical protein